MGKHKFQESKDEKLEEIKRKKALLKLELIYGVKDSNTSKMAKSGEPPHPGRLSTLHGIEKKSQLKGTPKAKSHLPNGKIDKFSTGDFSWIEEIPTCPVYYPTKDEFQDPLYYLLKIAPDASKYGICKIVSPLVVSAPAGVVLMKEKTDFTFTTRIQPLRMANWDNEDKIVFAKSGRTYTFREYEKMANKEFIRKFSSSANLPTKFMEEEFWREISSSKTTSVEYACDVDGSAFSDSSNDPLGSSKWNLKHIARHSESMLRHLVSAIPGVTDPMLYMGMLFSMFAWHVEDHYLYSLNYHHCGAPKTWYGIPGHASHEFEKVVRDHVYDREMLSDEAEGTVYDLLIGKTTMFPPSMLLQHGVPVFKVVQYPGEFVVTFPRAYHAGFSHGFNCGEAVNFATVDWFPFGEAACKRYEFLNKESILSQEELLCKEVMCSDLNKTSHMENHPPVQIKSSGSLLLKAAFVKLIRFQHQIIWLLRKLGADISVLSGSISTSRCLLCKRLCYVSYVVCGCYSHPICLNHVTEIQECDCGSLRTLFIREDFMAMVCLAQRFDQHEGILDKNLVLPTRDHTESDNSEIERSLYDYADFAEYDPYCHIRLQEGASGESSSSCEPLGQKKQKKGMACSGALGDASLSNVDHEKDSSVASKEGDAVSQPKKHRKIHKLSEHVKKGSKTKELGSSSLNSNNSPVNNDRERSPGRGGGSLTALIDKHQIKNGSDSQASEERDTSLSADRYKVVPRSIEVKPSKLLAETPYLKKQISSSRYTSKLEEKRIRLFSTPGGPQVLLISDILSAMKDGSPSLEIFKKWKQKLQAKAVDLKAYRVGLQSVAELRKIETFDNWGLSLKGCMELRKLLEEREVHVLKELVKETFGKLCQAPDTATQIVKTKVPHAEPDKKRKFNTMNEAGDTSLHRITGRRDHSNSQEVGFKKSSRPKVGENQNEKHLFQALKVQDDKKPKASQKHVVDKECTTGSYNHKLLHKEVAKHSKELQARMEAVLDTPKVCQNDKKLSMSKKEIMANNKNAVSQTGSSRVSKNMGSVGRHLEGTLKTKVHQNIGEEVAASYEVKDRSSKSFQGTQSRKGEPAEQTSRKLNPRGTDLKLINANKMHLKSDSERERVKQDNLGNNSNEKRVTSLNASSLTGSSRCQVLPGNTTVGIDDIVVPSVETLAAASGTREEKDLDQTQMAWVPQSSKHETIDDDADKLKGQREDALGLMDIDLVGGDFISEAGLSNLSFSSLDKSDRETYPEDEQCKVDTACTLQAEDCHFDLTDKDFEIIKSPKSDRDAAFIKEKPKDNMLQKNYSPGKSSENYIDKSCPSPLVSAMSPGHRADVHNDVDNQEQETYLRKSVTGNREGMPFDDHVSVTSLEQDKYASLKGHRRTGLLDSKETEISIGNVNRGFPWNKSSIGCEGQVEINKLNSASAVPRQSGRTPNLLNIERCSYKGDPANQPPAANWSYNCNRVQNPVHITQENCMDVYSENQSVSIDLPVHLQNEVLEDPPSWKSSEPRIKQTSAFSLQYGTEEASFGYENQNEDVVPYSPSSFALDYPSEFGKPKYSHNAESSFPSFPSNRENEDFANAYSRNIERVKHTSLSLCPSNSRSVCTRDISNYTEPDGSITVKGNSCDLRRPTILDTKDTQRHTNEITPDMHPSFLAPSAEPHDVAYNIGSHREREVGHDGFNVLDCLPKSQIPSHEDGSLWEEGATSTFHEQGNSHTELEPPRRAFSHSYTAAVTDPAESQGNSEADGYWPSFVSTPRQYQDDLRRQKLLIEKWGRA